MLQTNAPLLLWGLLVLGGLTVVALLIQATLSKSESHIAAPLTHVFRQLGLDTLPLFLAIVLSVLWTLLFLLLLAGLFGLITDVLLSKPPSRTNGDAVWDWRFKLVQLTALTTVLGAVVILPVTLLRLRLNKEQTETAKASLFNDKITEAAADLHAQRQVSKETESGRETVWEDDVVRRNAAIDRLEGLVREQPEEAARVSRLLSVYVRELSKVFPAKEPPNEEDINALKAWAKGLEAPRSDMQNAVQVLGRLAKNAPEQIDTLEIDLQNANLQAMELSNSFFRGASLMGANLQGTNLVAADLKHSVLSKAQLQIANLDCTQLEAAKITQAKLTNANLSNANLTRADLSRSMLKNASLWNADVSYTNLLGIILHGADLSGANLTGAHVGGVLFQPIYWGEGRSNHIGAEVCPLDTRVACRGTTFTGAALSHIDLSASPTLVECIDGVFGDGTVELPEGTQWPQHWPRERLEWRDFDLQWRAFAASKGVDIPD